MLIRTAIASNPRETTAGVPTGTTVTYYEAPVLMVFMVMGGGAKLQLLQLMHQDNWSSTLAAADNRKPATWLSIGSTILPGYEYFTPVEIAVPAGYQITKTNSSEQLQ